MSIEEFCIHRNVCYLCLPHCRNTWSQVSRDKDWSNSLYSTQSSFQNGSKDEMLNSEQDICFPLLLGHFSLVYLKEKRDRESWSVFVGVLSLSIACFCLLPYTGLYQLHDHYPGHLDTISFMENLSPKDCIPQRSRCDTTFFLLHSLFLLLSVKSNSEQIIQWWDKPHFFP